MSEYLAYCGSRCDLCPRYQATMAGDEGRLAELAELWYRCGWRDEILPGEEMTCTGCHPAMWCRYNIPACAVAHQVPHCGACENYQFCETVQDMFARNAAYKDQCEAVCSAAEFEMLCTICFSKKENLDAARETQNQQ